MANDRTYDYPDTPDRDADAYGRDYGSGRDNTYSNARDYRAAGERGGRDDRNFRSGGTGYGDRDNRSDYGRSDGGRSDYGRPDNWGGRETYGSGNRDYYGGSGEYGRDAGRDRQRSGGGEYRGAYASGGQRWTETGDRDEGRNRDYGRAPQGYDYQDRGFVARAGDEVRSWFGDEDAERRRDYDQRYDERQGGSSAANTAYGRDSDYHSWRRGQIDALDRDYHEYRQENARKFENEFGTWRSTRQTQRQSLGQVKDHMDVVGSDGGHVGTVDKVRGDRIILTKNDTDAGGKHHSIPSSWIQTVDDKVTIGKTADDAHKHWRDEEASGAMFGAEDRSQGRPAGRETGRDRDGNVNLNRSFSGTY